MKWLSLIVVFTYVVSASNYAPNACKAFENMEIDKVMSSEYDYAGSCKVLYAQLKDAKKAQMPQKALYFGYALQTLEDIERFGIKTDENKVAVVTRFKRMNKALVEKQVIDENDYVTVYKGLLVEENKVYRFYLDDFRLKVVKEELESMIETENVISMEEHLMVNTNGSCLSVREAPYKEAKLIDCIKNKSHLITVVSSNALNGYIKVNFMGGTGWVSKKFTKSNKDK